MKLWEIDGFPEKVLVDGTDRYYQDGVWHPLDTWELLSEGGQFSYLELQRRWAGLVDEAAYLAGQE